LDSADAHAGSGPVPPEGRTSARKRRLLIAGISAVVIAVLVVFGIPTIRLALNTVSTDDAYVNGHLTFVAPRVRGHVVRVLVDDNNRVHKGDILVELDKEPYQNAVAVSKAAVDTAKANLLVATATVRGIEAEARSRRWKLQNAIEAVGNQVALLPGSPPSIRAGPT
jgi:membrane fusion protein, multidrug efflux system